MKEIFKLYLILIILMVFGYTINQVTFFDVVFILLFLPAVFSIALFCKQYRWFCEKQRKAEDLQRKVDALIRVLDKPKS